MIINFFAIILLLCSCAEGILGGVAVSTVVFSKTDYTIFPAHVVYSTQKNINTEMKNNKQDGHQIKIIQDKNILYVIGSVGSTKIKARITEILDTAFEKRYMNEIVVSTEKRTSIADFALKTKIKQKLLFAKYVSSGNYKVYVYNQKAFIIGQAKSNDEREIITKLLSKIEYIDDIVAYIITV